MIAFAFSRALTSGKRKSGHAVVIAVTDSLKLSGDAATLDKAAGGALSRAIAASSFKGKAGQTLLVPGIEGSAADRALLVRPWRVITPRFEDRMKAMNSSAKAGILRSRELP